MNLRSLFRKFCYTANTIRYRVEWPRIEEAFFKAGSCETLFDGGAGSGEFSRRALTSGLCKRVIALEYDRHNFVTLQNNLGREMNTQLINGSLLEVPLPDASVDAVLCTQVIEHIADHEKAAAELCRILKPGGHAIITVPRPPEPFHTDDHKREGYTEEDLRALFVPNGMQSLWEDWFLTHSTTARMLRAWRLPLGGKFVPVSWVDREMQMTREQRRDDSPYGLLMLFKKTS